jgi:hypothetical protein
MMPTPKTPKTKWWVRAVGALCAVCTMICALPASAEPSFPKDVDTFIMQPGLVEGLFPDSSQPGCHLCHVNGSLGQLPLTPFGTALRIQSTAPSDGELQAALGTLSSTNPRAFMDLEMGQDPNQDPTALSGDPVPQYGCGSIAAGHAGGLDAAGLVIGLAALTLLGRSGRRRPFRAREAA